MSVDNGDSDVEEEKGGDELSDEGSVEGPELELTLVEEWCRWRVHVVLVMVVALLLFAQ